MNRKEKLTIELERVRRALVMFYGSEGDKMFDRVVDEMIRQEEREEY